MKRVEYRDALTVNLSESQRRVIEGLAARQEVSLSAATRFLIDRGISATGLKA